MRREVLFAHGVLARFLDFFGTPSESVLKVLSDIMRSPDQSVVVEQMRVKIRRYRRTQRKAFLVICLGFSWFAVLAIALPILASEHIQIHWWLWITTYIPLIFFGYVIVVIFRVERRYREVGL